MEITIHQHPECSHSTFKEWSLCPRCEQLLIDEKEKALAQKAKLEKEIEAINKKMSDLEGRNK
jgi:hypothetical protein